MATNKQLLSRGIKYIAGSLPLLFMGPSLIYSAFINKQNLWHYLVLAVGIAVCVTSVYLLFRGLNLIMKSLFND